MKTMQVTCTNCGGIGQIHRYELTSDHKAQHVVTVCENCNGKGWIEYAMFSVEEANAILKHCDLSTES